ncbi:MAG: Gfo/Idh/MocA family oxidoreductase [Oscillospiraceae bacterium]|nr:Gfo/Idh/MocA family oxidoreductase [Oscillospiraceae bacterium]
MKKIGIGIVGIGAISGIYLDNLTKVFKEVEIMGVCDLIPERAQKAADEYGVSIYKDMHELFADPKVEIVLNLTRPYEHFEVTTAALLAGKHVYSEKPIAVDMDEAAKLVALAKDKGLLLGGAPDTFMGAGIQTARRIIDAGLIGDIVGADCAMICRGHETWHPDPEFYYKRGGGPMLDMGPYYVTALCNLLGEAKAVMGMTKKSFDTRLITSEPHFGETVTVDIDTHLTGCIEFTSGAIAQIVTTFDVHYSAQARFEVYGTDGTLVVPDPNTFGGNVLLFRPEESKREKIDPGLLKPEEISLYRGYRHMPLMFGYRENSRALGLADMCKAVATGRAVRANSDLQMHVLEILTSFSKSCKERKYIELTTKYERGAPMKNLAMPGILD